MNDCNSIPANGTKLIVTQLQSTVGFLINPKYLELRRSGECVTMMGYVPGHGGDVWWCQHENGDIQAYSWTELEYFEDQFNYEI